MKVTAYLAGPDVFLPDAREHARHKVAICAKHGIAGRPPLSEDIESLSAMPEEEAWRAIFRKDLAIMEGCGIVIANLTPFRSASADAGTLVELGWFLGRGRPVFGYSNAALPFAERSRLQTAVVPDPMPGLTIEGFGLPDNLMIPGAVLEGGGHPMLIPHDGRDRAFDALDVFERCVEVAAARLGVQPAPAWMRD
jgi:nucleoside 2-deoxyribosyltransferase